MLIHQNCLIYLKCRDARRFSGVLDSVCTRANMKCCLLCFGWDPLILYRINNAECVLNAHILVVDTDSGLKYVQESLRLLPVKGIISHRVQESCVCTNLDGTVVLLVRLVEFQAYSLAMVCMAWQWLADRLNESPRVTRPTC